MDPILRIIHYLFIKNEIDGFDDTFDSFFGNGVAFPNFVAFALKTPEIPNINKNPKLVFHKNMNNTTALQYLFVHNSAIAKISPNFTTSRDKAGLLSLILTKLIYPLNLPTIIDQCNIIVKPLGITFSKKSDIIRAECILSLLNILTDGKVPIRDDTSDFDQLMKNSFELANAPLVIDKTSLEFQNQFVFLIQLEILFEFFKDKIDQKSDKKDIERLKEIEAQKKLAEQKEMERLKELDKQMEIEKQKKFEKQKEIEKLREIERQKEIAKQKELEQKELERRQKLEEQMKLQKQQEQQEQNEQQEENDQNELDEQSEQNELDELDDTSDTDINLLPDDKDDLKGFSDIEDNEDLSHENGNENDNEIEIEEVDSEVDENDESTEIFDSIESSTKEENKSKRSSLISSKFLSSDWKSLDITSSTLEEIQLMKSSSDSEDALADLETIEIPDVNFEEDEEDEYDEGEFKEKIIKKNEEDHSMKRKLGSKFLKKTSKENEELEAILDAKLLVTINKIDGKNFENFNQTIENDEIPKFVMHVLNRNSIKNVILQKEQPNQQKEQTNLTKSQIKNIKEVINYLKLKEPKFKVLMFDFTNSIYIESSAISFYRTFINYFYLRSTKKQLFERCVTLLYNRIKKEDLQNEVKLLTDWNTYILLGLFIFKKKLHFEESFNVEEYFNHIALPIIIDKDFLKHCSKLTELPISIYCQLQFIFDRIDQIGGTYHIVEIFSKALRGINMRVPKSDALASAIRAKNISSILQNKEYKNFIIQKNVNYFGEAEEEEEVKKIMPVQPLPFSDRKNSDEYKISKEMVENTVKLQESADSYWNPPDSSFSFDDGIFYRKYFHEKKKNKSLNDWIDEMTIIQKNVSKKTALKTVNLNSQKEKLYIFFNYDFEGKKWKRVDDPFGVFSHDKKIKSNEMKTPLILFINSKTEDLKNVAVNLEIVKDNYPDFNENQIYVYGLGDLKYNKKNSNNIEELIHPIFLFLHVPTKLKGLPNLSTIIYSIYSFLFFICDIEIVVLNKDYYNDQIEMLKSFNFISNSYKEDDKNDMDINYKSKSSELHLLSASDSSDEENEIFDDSDSDFADDNEEEENYQYENFTKISSNVFSKKRQIIALVNDDSNVFYNPKEIYANFNKNIFFNSKKLEIHPEFCQIHYINANDYDSYKSFMNNLTKLVLKDESLSTFDDVSRNFRFVKLTEMSSQYIKLKTEGKWEEQLTSLINKRYSLLSGQNKMHNQYLTILANLREELIKMSPSIDLDFKNKCEFVLSEIKKNESQNNKKIFIDEIENSSRLNLDYLKKVIDNEKFWSDRGRENLINSHILFLKDEFFNIIKVIYQNDSIKSVYEENIKILNDKIKNDTEIINGYFALFDENANKLKNEAKLKKKDEVKIKSRKGSNYTIREAENTREIKVTVQINDDLRDEIKQDF